MRPHISFGLTRGRKHPPCSPISIQVRRESDKIADRTAKWNPFVWPRPIPRFYGPAGGESPRKAGTRSLLRTFRRFLSLPAESAKCDDLKKTVGTRDARSLARIASRRFSHRRPAALDRSRELSIALVDRVATSCFRLPLS